MGSTINNVPTGKEKMLSNYISWLRFKVLVQRPKKMLE
jgi:hypothetical protein